MGGMKRFALFALVVVLCASRPANAGATQAVGMIFSRGIDGAASGNGIFMRDGTWMITARSAVFPSRVQGLHVGEVMVTVLSPYLGEAGEAQVVAQDREAGLVLLRVPWKGHPTLQLAAEADVMAAVQVDAVGYAAAPSSGKLTRATLAVGGIVVRR